MKNSDHADVYGGSLPERLTGKTYPGTEWLEGGGGESWSQE